MPRYAIHVPPTNRKNKYTAGRRLGLVYASSKKAAFNKYLRQHPRTKRRILRVFNTRVRK